MAKPKSRWKRRADARPAEIVAAAFAVFSEKGFAAARLDDIAARAGVAKSSLYVYFETKEDLFRAVVQGQVAPNLDAIKSVADAYQGPFAELAPVLLKAVAQTLSDDRLAGMIRMVIGESGNFPDLAKIWHDDLLSRALGAMAGVVARAQARGELAKGDPRQVVFSLIGPMLMAALYRSVFARVAKEPPDLSALAESHARIFLDGALNHQARSKT